MNLVRREFGIPEESDPKKANESVYIEGAGTVLYEPNAPRHWVLNCVTYWHCHETVYGLFGIAHDLVRMSRRHNRAEYERLKAIFEPERVS